MISETAQNAANQKFRVDSHGAGAWIHPYIGTNTSGVAPHARVAGDPQPMVYLVDQDPGTTIPTHFHQVPQFQVVVGGEGKLGSITLKTLMVHYAGAFTGYGPLHAGPAGLKYLTLRSHWDPGLRPLPEARAELFNAPSRRPLHLLSKPFSLASAGPDLSDGQTDCTSVLDGGVAGGSALLYRLAPGANAPVRSDARAACSVLVLSGQILLDEQIYSPMDCLFVPANGDMGRIRAAGAQAQLLWLTFPLAAQAAHPGDRAAAADAS